MSDLPRITIEAYGQTRIIEFLGGHRDPGAMDQEGTLGRAVLEALDGMRLEQDLRLQLGCPKQGPKFERLARALGR